VNIFVSQTIGFIVLRSNLVDLLREFAKYKLKEKKSLSSRILFKYTDLVTLIDKKI
jgi:hypothetical protein